MERTQASWPVIVPPAFSVVQNQTSRNLYQALETLQARHLFTNLHVSFDYSPALQNHLCKGVYCCIVSKEVLLGARESEREKRLSVVCWLLAVVSRQRV